MNNVRGAPPVRWLFGTAQQRQIARRYWIRDVVVGLWEGGLYHLLRYLPVDLASGIGAAIAHISRHLYRESEQRARKLWVTLRPTEADAASVDAAMTRLWRCVSRTMAEFAVLDRLWAAGRIAVDGGEHLDRARRENKAVILAALHLGNWEVIQVACIALGHGGYGLYLPPENRFEHRIAVGVRTRLGSKLIPAGPNSARLALRILQQRHDRLAIWIDEFARGRVQAPAFGRRLRADSNLAYALRLAAKTGAVIIPIYCLRLGDAARFKVTVLPPVDLVYTGDKNADLMRNSIRLDAIIAPIIRNHLDQWYFALDFDFDS